MLLFFRRLLCIFRRLLCIFANRHSWEDEIEVGSDFVWETRVCRVCGSDELVYGGSAK